MTLSSIQSSRISERTLLLKKREKAMAEKEKNVFRKLIFTIFAAAVASWILSNAANLQAEEQTVSSAGTNPGTFSSAFNCTDSHCYTRAKIQVNSKDGFPSFWTYANKGAIKISYDSRSILIDNERVLLLGGSLHPSRATKSTWDYALDEVVRNGLNLITIYVFWEDHQPIPTQDIDWNFPKSVQCNSASRRNTLECDWNLASSIRTAAERGLFVHIRIGPYACAEYTYGGIPEFIPLHYPNMSMRRPNLEWLKVMKSFVENMINYLDENYLWAHQGGPIILGQIENELGGEVDPVSENFFFIDEKGNYVSNEDYDIINGVGGLRNATLQDYADWCGKLVQELAPNVTWVRLPNSVYICCG
jgi:hypothetical protein